MADEKKPVDKSSSDRPDPFVEIVWFILSILVLVYLLNGILGLINSTAPSIFGLKLSGTEKSVSLSKAPSLIGGKVVTSKSTAVFAEPGLNQIATMPAGSKATIIEGPMIKDGVKYWHVKFEDGTEGWVAEDNLNYLKVEKQPLSSVQNPAVGDKVAVSRSSTPVFAEPGVNQIGMQKANAEGDIIGGPETKDGVKYWKVRFADGMEGWVAESNLDYIKTTPVPLSSMSTMIGAKVLTSKDGTALYDSPGGKQIGTIKKGATGKIIEGPIIKDGVKYWHIKFDDGQEGWVAEGDLEYIVGSEPGLLTKTIGFFKKLFSTLKYVIWGLSALLVWVVVYLFKKLVALRTDEAKKFYVEKPELGSVNNPKWDKILRNIESPNESDWRLAILEADIMLDMLLDNMGLPGETMSDKLKAVEKSDFTTIENAWEAHKIRNQVAHDGATFVVSQHEAKRVINLYRTVFDEFKII